MYDFIFTFNEQLEKHINCIIRFDFTFALSYYCNVDSRTRCSYIIKYLSEIMLGRLNKVLEYAMCVYCLFIYDFRAENIWHANVCVIRQIDAFEMYNAIKRGFTEHFKIKIQVP